MTAQQQLIALLEKDLAMNWELLALLDKMPPEEKKVYLPKVEHIINNTTKLLELAKTK